jgi:hypothetical protein
VNEPSPHTSSAQSRTDESMSSHNHAEPAVPDPVEEIAQEIAWSMALEGRPLSEDACQRLTAHIAQLDVTEITPSPEE